MALPDESKATRGELAESVPDSMSVGVYHDPAASACGAAEIENNPNTNPKSKNDRCFFFIFVFLPWVEIADHGGLGAHHGSLELDS